MPILINKEKYLPFSLIKKKVLTIMDEKQSENNGFMRCPESSKQREPKRWLQTWFIGSHQKVGFFISELPSKRIRVVDSSKF
jgi:hypothetical protein